MPPRPRFSDFRPIAAIHLRVAPSIGLSVRIKPSRPLDSLRIATPLPNAAASSSLAPPPSPLLSSPLSATTFLFPVTPPPPSATRLPHTPYPPVVVHAATASRRPRPRCHRIQPSSAVTLPDQAVPVGQKQLWCESGIREAVGRRS